jgi:hypothetical protein
MAWTVYVNGLRPSPNAVSLQTKRMVDELVYNEVRSQLVLTKYL